MKYLDCILLWTSPKDSPEWPVAMVKVVPHKDKLLESNLYANSGGASFYDAWGDEEVVKYRILRDFQHLVVDQEMDPQQVHREFLKIQEYRRLLKCFM